MLRYANDSKSFNQMLVAAQIFIVEDLQFSYFNEFIIQNRSQSAWLRVYVW